MEMERRRTMRGRGGRQQSIFRSPDDYERHMQDSIGADDEAYYEDLPHEQYASSTAVDDAEHPVAD